MPLSWLESQNQKVGLCFATEDKELVEPGYLLQLFYAVFGRLWF